MDAQLDHIVIWVKDPARSVEFFETVVGFTGVRMTEYETGQVPFPSVRVSDRTILDLMNKSMAPVLDAMATGLSDAAARSAGHPVNHVCFSMSERDFTALRQRLEGHGVRVGGELERSFGAQGYAPRTFYFHDLDGNVFEARYYSEQSGA